MPVSGKLGDQVYVRSNKYDYHSRAAPQKGKKREEDGLKKQYSRTSYLNAMAASINGLVASYAGIFKGKSYYHELLSLLRKEPEDHYFLLLKQLEGSEVNPKYAFERFKQFSEITSRHSGRKLAIELKSSFHPAVVNRKINCYNMEVLLLVFNVEKQQWVDSSQQLTEWIYMHEPVPIFDFDFTLPVKDCNWLVFVKTALGINGVDIDTFAGMGIGILHAGSSIKKEISLLNEKKALEEKTMVARKKKVEVLTVKRRS